MSILVICPGCSAKFQVGDKFAGRKGPCPKCKAPITIPNPDDVKIHMPDAVGAGGKSKTGRPSLKPLKRQDTKVRLIPALAIGAGVLGAVLVGWLGGELIRQNVYLRAGGILLLSFPSVLAGYAFLRNDELEPHRGAALWIRSGLCALAYSALWGAFSFVPDGFSTEMWHWFFLAPPFMFVGAGTALVFLDLDFGNGFFHYCFFLVVSIAMRWIIGMPELWAGSTSIT